MDDSRFRYWCSVLDDLRAEMEAMAEETPPRFLQHHLQQMRDGVNHAVRHGNYAQGKCTICGGIGKVMRAAREGNGFNWLGGCVIQCPACALPEVE